MTQPANSSATWLLESVRTAFVHGMDLALVISAAVALAGVVLALTFAPGRSTTRQGRAPVPASR